MKKIVLAVGLLCALVLLCACGTEKAPDGMQLASDTKIVDYKLYVPETWVVDAPSFSDGEKTVKEAVSMAHVSDSDRSSVSVAQWNLTETVSTVQEWYADYQSQLATAQFRNFAWGEQNQNVVMGQLPALQCDYTADFGETTYHFMVVAVKHNGSIYVLTYTSTAELYDSHLTEVSQILENFAF